MNIAVLSLPGSGTHLVRDGILSGWQKDSVFSDLTGRDGVVITHHWTDGWEIGIEASGRCFAIVPVRHPNVHMDYWGARSFNLTQAELLEAWEKLIALPGLHFLPIDSMNRDYWLGEINQAGGLTLSTEWPVMNKGADRPAITLPLPALPAAVREFAVKYWGAH